MRHRSRSGALDGAASGVLDGTERRRRRTRRLGCVQPLRTDPVTSASFVTDPVDTGFDAELRVFLAAISGLGTGQSGVPAITYAIDTWLTGQNDPGTFTAWPSVGYVAMRYLRARFSYAPVQGSLAYITDFVPTIDTAPTVEAGNSLTVSAGGTTDRLSGAIPCRATRGRDLHQQCVADGERRRRHRDRLHLPCVEQQRRRCRRRDQLRSDGG